MDAQDVESWRQRQDLRLMQVLMAKGCSPDEATRQMEAWSDHAQLTGIEPDDDYVIQGERWLRLGQELVGRSLDAAS